MKVYGRECPTTAVTPLAAAEDDAGRRLIIDDG
jgi:hypothetical protein